MLSEGRDAGRSGAGERAEHAPALADDEHSGGWAPGGRTFHRGRPLGRRPPWRRPALDGRRRPAEREGRARGESATQQAQLAASPSAAACHTRAHRLGGGRLGGGRLGGGRRLTGGGGRLQGREAPAAQPGGKVGGPAGAWQQAERRVKQGAWAAHTRKRKECAPGWRGLGVCPADLLAEALPSQARRQAALTVALPALEAELQRRCRLVAAASGYGTDDFTGLPDHLHLLKSTATASQASQVGWRVGGCVVVWWW